MNSNTKMKNLALLVIFFGLIMTTLTGFSSVKRRKIANFSSMELSRQEPPLYWSPATGGMLIVSGIVLLSAGGARRKNLSNS